MFYTIFCIIQKDDFVDIGLKNEIVEIEEQFLEQRRLDRQLGEIKRELLCSRLNENNANM